MHAPSTRGPTSRERGPGFPIALLPFAVLGALVVVVPVGGLLARVPWPDVWELITAPDSLTALRLSLTTATVSTVVCVLLGVPLGLVLARTEARPLRLVRALVLLPVVLPPVVGGLALLATFGRRGILAAPMAATGIDIAFTTAAVVAAQVFVAMPFCCCRRSRPPRSCPSPAPWASSARPSPSPAPWRARPAPCRSRSTCAARRTRTPPWPSPSSSSRSP
jgi:ABC-type sulfate transport system permease component